MLDLAAIGENDSVAHDRVVERQDFDRGPVADVLRQRRRVDDVGEEDGADRGVEPLGVR